MGLASCPRVRQDGHSHHGSWQCGVASPPQFLLAETRFISMEQGELSCQTPASQLLGAELSIGLFEAQRPGRYSPCGHEGQVSPC